MDRAGTTRCEYQGGGGMGNPRPRLGRGRGSTLRVGSQRVSCKLASFMDRLVGLGLLHPWPTCTVSTTIVSMHIDWPSPSRLHGSGQPFVHAGGGQKRAPATMTHDAAANSGPKSPQVVAAHRGGGGGGGGGSAGAAGNADHAHLAYPHQGGASAAASSLSASTASPLAQTAPSLAPPSQEPLEQDVLKQGEYIGTENGVPSTALNTISADEPTVRLDIRCPSLDNIPKELTRLTVRLAASIADVKQCITETWPGQPPSEALRFFRAGQLLTDEMLVSQVVNEVSTGCPCRNLLRS